MYRLWCICFCYTEDNFNILYTSALQIQVFKTKSIYKLWGFMCLKYVYHFINNPKINHLYFLFIVKGEGSRLGRPEASCLVRFKPQTERWTLSSCWSVSEGLMTTVVLELYNKKQLLSLPLIYLLVKYISLSVQSSHHPSDFYCNPEQGLMSSLSFWMCIF